MDITDFQLLARYNLWATQRLTTHLNQIEDQDFYRDCGLFFKSILGTLNHILVGEHLLWFTRFNSGSSPTFSLNQIVETDRYTLCTELNTRAKNWLDFLDQCPQERLNSMLTYTSTNGQSISLPFTHTLMHVFNHATHHRGQISAALSIMGYPCPELDLIYMLLEEARTN